MVSGLPVERAGIRPKEERSSAVSYAYRSEEEMMGLYPDNGLMI
jgi:hypothetical protein